jgi:hypothetical protein
MQKMSTWASEDTFNSKQRLNRDNIVELILDPDSDSEVSDCEQPDSGVYDN